MFWTPAILLKSTLILSAALPVALLAGTAALRHAVWTAALLVLPLLLISIPDIPATQLLAAASVLFRVDAVAAPFNAITAAAPGNSAPNAPPARRLPWVLIWSVIAGLLALRAIGGQVILYLRTRHAPRAPHSEIPTLLYGDMPAIAGLLRPRLLLPVGFDQWPADRRRAVLLHELAHARRFDCLTRFLSQLVCAAFWFQPLVWFAAWRARIEQEQAADDAVILAGERHTDYAAHLLEVARLHVMPTALAMAKPSTLHQRLESILDGSVNRRALAAPQLAAIAVTLTFLALAVGALHPAQAAPPQAPAPAATASPSASLYQQALQAHHKHNNTLAEELYMKELERLRATQPDPEQQTRIATLLGILMDQQTRAADAERWFKEAIAASDNKAVGAALDCYIDFLKRHDRAPEAVAPAERVKQLRTPFKVRTPAPAGAYKVGGGVTTPKLISKVEPSYSDVARILKTVGASVLYVEISPEGQATKIRVVRPLGFGLDENAIDAVSEWKFAPATKDGKAVTVQATIEVNFRLL